MTNCGWESEGRGEAVTGSDLFHTYSTCLKNTHTHTRGKDLESSSICGLAIAHEWEQETFEVNFVLLFINHANIYDLLVFALKTYTSSVNFLHKEAKVVITSFYLMLTNTAHLGNDKRKSHDICGKDWRKKSLIFDYLTFSQHWISLQILKRFQK